MIKMKALRSFGVSGANEGKVKRGREFSAATEARVRDLEDHGLAYRLDTARTEPPAVNQIAPSTSNEAANTGPLGSHGGTTGADAPVPSSPADHPQRRRRLQRSKSDEDLLS